MKNTLFFTFGVSKSVFDEFGDAECVQLSRMASIEIRKTLSSVRAVKSNRLTQHLVSEKHTCFLLQSFVTIVRGASGKIGKASWLSKGKFPQNCSVDASGTSETHEKLACYFPILFGGKWKKL